MRGRGTKQKEAWMPLPGEKRPLEVDLVSSPHCWFIGTIFRVLRLHHLCKLKRREKALCLGPQRHSFLRPGPRGCSLWLCCPLRSLAGLLEQLVIGPLTMPSAICSLDVVSRLLGIGEGGLVVPGLERCLHLSAAPWLLRPWVPGSLLSFPVFGSYCE